MYRLVCSRILGSILSCFLFAIGCSNGTNQNISFPLEPGAVKDSSSADMTEANRVLWGIWELHFDCGEMEVSVEPVRNVQQHFDVTDMILPPACNDCLQVTINSINPATQMLDADVTLRNPYSIAGYDVRGILFTDEAGHELVNADDWTKLFDIPGGDTLNPFKAFAKNMPHRRFSGHAQHTENYLIHFPTPPQFETITFAATASWPGNCKEPYSIDNFAQTELYGCIGAKADLLVYVYDWQDDIAKVTLVAPEITDEDFTQFTNWGGNVWSLEIANLTGTAPGDYKARLIATSSGSGSVALYDYVTITISEGVPSGGWAVTWGGSVFESEHGLATYGTGNAYVVGNYEDTIDLDPGPDVDNHTSIGSRDCYICSFNPTGVYRWAGSWGGNGLDDIQGAVVDNSGNVYVMGTFENTVDFDPGPGVFYIDSNGVYDIFISKFNPNGGFMWSISWGGADTDWGRESAVDSSGNIYTIGYFKGLVDFDPGPGKEEHTSADAMDFFLSKLDSDGDFQWVAIWDAVESYDVVVDDEGDIYLTGRFSKTKDFDPGAGIDEHTAIANDDAFLMKLNSDSEYQWGVAWGGTSSEEGSALAASKSGNIYVAGVFHETVDFDPGAPVVERSSNGFESDVYISKFDQNGSFQWVSAWGGTGPDDAQGVAVSDGDDIYITGAFAKTVDFDPGPGVVEYSSQGAGDIYICRYDAAGNFQWARAWGGTQSDSYYCGDIGVDGVGNVYLAGDFGDVVDFDPGPGIDSHTATGSSDLFLVKIKPDGYW